MTLARKRHAGGCRKRNHARTLRTHFGRRVGVTIQRRESGGTVCDRASAIRMRHATRDREPHQRAREREPNSVLKASFSSATADGAMTARMAP